MFARPVGSGAAWLRSPHQKSAGREREREKKKRKERKKERREEKEKEEKKKRDGDESKRERCVVGLKHPLQTVKNCKRHGKRGGGKKTHGKDSW